MLGHEYHPKRECSHAAKVQCTSFFSLHNVALEEGIDYMIINDIQLKGHDTQHSGHTGQNLKIERNIEMQLVRPTEVCGKA